MEPVSDLEPGRDLVAYTYKSLESFTKGFSPENYVGDTQYGKLYRGQIQKVLETLGVIVKIWVDDSSPYPTTAEHQLSRWQVCAQWTSLLDFSWLLFRLVFVS